METIQVGSIGIRFLISNEQTGGSVDIFEFTVPAAAKVPVPHYHKDFDEFLYGLEGILTWYVDGKAIDVGPGQSVFIPRGTVHHFENRGDVTVRQLSVITPGKLGPSYFTELGENIKPGVAPDFAKLTEIMLKYGLIPV